MAKFVFNMPDIGEGIAEAEIVQWHKKVGDTVREDEEFVDMMTDKATVPMESPVDGKILEIAGEEGDMVSIGSMLVVIEVEGDIPDDVAEENDAATETAAAPAPKADEVEERIEVENSDPSDADDAMAADPTPPPAPTPAPAPEPAAAPSTKVLASPAVRKRAKELGVDLAQVKPAEDGRVRHGDLDQFLSYNSGYGAAAKTREDEEKKVIGMRRRIAENMAASKRNIPHFSYVEECDVTQLEVLRAQLNDARGDKPKLTILPLLITAICKTLPDFPMINARYDDEAGVVTRHGSVNMGMAAQTDAGLMVPVIKNAHAKNLWQLANEISRLADAARAWLGKMYDASLGRFNRWYNRALGFFLKRRLDLAFILLALLAATSFVFEKVGFSVQQERNMASFNLSFRFPSQFNFDERTEYFKQVEQQLNKSKDYYELDGFIIFYSAWFGELEGWFARDRKGTIPAREVAEKIYKELPKIPGLKIEYQRMDEGWVKQDKKGQYYVRIKGQDPEQLEKLSNQLKPSFLNIPGVIALKQRQDETPNELALIVDRDRANSIGVNPTTLAGMVGYALRGSTLPRFNSDGRQIPVRVRYSEENRAELADLNNFLVPTEDGQFSSIGTLTRPAMLNSPRYIRRTDKSVSHTFGLELESGKEEETRKAIKSLQDSIDLPEGISFGEIRERFDIKEIFNGIFALMLAITFIYLLMAFLFESVIMPISIVLSIPLAAIGSVWIHLIAGKEMDFLGIVGCVLLVGVVVNNGIVLIDYANRLRQTGMDRTKALLQASNHRFRPIAITALTTIIGMIPLTLSKSSDMGMSYNSFGLTLIGGMISGTLLTLLVVPVFYTLLDDAQLAIQNTLASVMRPQAKPSVVK